MWHVREERCILGFGGETWWKEPLVRPSNRWENFKMDLKEMVWGGAEWASLTQVREKWRAVVKIWMNPLVLAGCYENWNEPPGFGRLLWKLEWTPWFWRAVMKIGMNPLVLVGCCENWNEPTGFINWREFSWLAEELVACQAGLRCIKLVNCLCIWNH